MDLSEQFEMIRPYRDHEVKPAIERLVSHPGFKGGSDLSFRRRGLGELTQKFRSIESIDHFQVIFSYHTVTDHSEEKL